MKKILKLVYVALLKNVCRKCYETQGTAAPVTFKSLFFQKIIGFNRNAYWPVHFSSVISNYKNIKIGIGTAPGLSPGCYIQGIGKIYIGDYTIIAANVGIISSNHDLYDSKKHIKTTVSIGDYCWIGMNSTILPKVSLGDFTIVGAGSVVTKSFNEGYCVIAGNPAKIVKKLEPNKCKKYKNRYEYYGFIKKENFEKFKKKKLNV